MAKGRGLLQGPRWIQSATEMTFYWGQINLQFFFYSGMHTTWIETTVAHWSSQQLSQCVEVGWLCLSLTAMWLQLSPISIFTSRHSASLLVYMQWPYFLDLVDVIPLSIVASKSHIHTNWLTGFDFLSQNYPVVSICKETKTGSLSTCIQVTI